MFRKASSSKCLHVLILLVAVSQIRAACKNNEARLENREACVGQHTGALVAYPGDCSKFLVCVKYCDYPTVKECPADFWWDNTHKFCNIPLLVDCDNSSGTTTPVVKTTTTEKQSTSTTESTQTTKNRCNNEPRPENRKACDGHHTGALVAYPGDCSKYLVCVKYCDYPTVKECPADLWWDNTHKFCNIPLLVDCNNSSGTTTPVDNTTTEKITTSTTESTQTTRNRCNNEARPENREACAGHRSGALVAYPGDCSKYLVCSKYCDYPTVRDCPADLWWDNTHKFCSLPLLVDCDNSSGTTTPVGNTTTEKITTSTTESTQTIKNRCNNEERPENREACDGHHTGALVAYPGDCSKYLICVKYCDYPTVRECPAYLWWDNTHKFCSLPLLVDCDNSSGTTTPVGNTTTEKTTTSTTESTQTTKNRCNNEARPQNREACDGHHTGALVAYPGDCSKYLVCVKYCDYPTVRECPADLWWDNTHKFCSLPLLVDCDNSFGTTTPIDKTTTEKTSTSTTESTQTTRNRCNNEARPENREACNGDRSGALVSYPGDCSKYLVCSKYCDYPTVKECPADLWWDNTHKFCSLPVLVDCDNSSGTTTPIDKTTTTEKITTSTTESTQTTKNRCNNEARPENREACNGHRAGALVAYPGDCSKYLVCVKYCSYPTVRDCPLGLWWDNTHKFCNIPLLVDCDNSSGSTTPIDKTTTTEKTTTPSTESTTESSNCVAPEGMSADICLNNGDNTLLKYPYNCNAYINCTMGCPVMNYCPAGKVFNIELKICDSPSMDKCEELPLPGTTTTQSPLTTTDQNLSPTQHCENQELGATFAYKQNCQQYIFCNGKGGFLIQNCPNGNYYNRYSGICEAGDDEDLCF